MKQFRLFLNSLVLAALALSISLQANISPLAFNGVFKCFKPGYEMYAPNLGCTALQTGLVHALRFYTTIPGRLWINDKAAQDDPVAALALLLFPSPAGNLTAMTSHPDNIGRHLTAHDVANLLNFCARVRNAIQNIKNNPGLDGNELGKKIKKALKLIAQASDPKALKLIAQASNCKTLKVITQASGPQDLKVIVQNFGPEDLKLIAEASGPEALKLRAQASGSKTLKLIAKASDSKALELIAQASDPEGLNPIPEAFSIEALKLVAQASYIKHKNKMKIIKILYANRSLDTYLKFLNIPSHLLEFKEGKYLLSLLYRCIELEERDDRKKEFLDNPLQRKNFEKYQDSTFYAQYTPEQLLNAFFCLKFGKDDIPNLINNLDDQIVDHEVILDDRLLDQTNLEQATQKQAEAITLDDLWVMQNRDLIDAGIPYARGCKPVNNGLALGYDRTNNELIVAQEFPDCTETTIRHLCNLLLYSKEGFFKLEQVRAQLQNSPIQNLIQNLEEFYALQSPDKANSGERSIRNAWNKVVGDLGAPVRYKLKNNTEISPGIINIIRVLNIIFNLQLDSEPVYKNNQQFAYAVRQWAQIALEKLFEKISPDKKADIQIAGLYPFKAFGNYEYDCSGTIQVTVNQDFKFTISIRMKHAQFDSINILVPKKIIHKSLSQSPRSLKNIMATTTGESLFLLNTRTKKEITIPAYQLFQNGISDSYQIIKSLECLCTMIEKNKISSARSARILRNLLQNFLWQDHEMASNIQPVLCNLFNTKNQSIHAILKEEVKVIKGDELLSDCFNHKSDDLLTFFANLKVLDFSGSGITELEISGDTCPHLEKLNLKNTQQLQSLKLSGPLPKLTIINLYESYITELEISGNRLPNLKSLDLSGTQQLQNLKISGVLHNIKTIDLYQSGITELEISGDTLPKLESLNLKNTQQLQSLKLSGALPKLTIINLYGSYITELEISGDTLPNLESLNLGCTEQLQSLKLSGALNNLKTIYLAESGITELEISGDTLPNLESLNLGSTQQLQSLKLSVLHNLKTIYLNKSGITELDISGDTLPNLESLNLGCTQQLQSLKLSGVLHNLKTIDLSYSTITKFEISGNTCPHLESLNLQSTILLRSLELSGAFPSLKAINLYESGIIKLEISGTCPNLEFFYLIGARQLQILKISGALNNLKIIDLEKSNIRELEISGNTCPHLQKLNLYKTEKLIRLKFSGVLNNLETIDLYQSGITEVQIFRNCCPNLIPNDSRIKIIDREKKDHENNEI